MHVDEGVTQIGSQIYPTEVFSSIPIIVDDSAVILVVSIPCSLN